MVRFGLERRRGRGGLISCIPCVLASLVRVPFAKRRGGVGGCILEVVLVDPNCAGRVFFAPLESC